jgi:hypothetical protein
MADFKRRSGNRLLLTLAPEEVEVLRDLVGQLGSLLDGGVPERGSELMQERTRDRLFPRAYLDPTEDESETEWQSAVHEDLVRQKSEAVGALVDSLDTGSDKRDGSVQLTLAPEVMEQWAGALNDLRLALGVLLDITDEHLEPDPADPRFAGFQIYNWLTWLQGALVQVLLSGLGTEGGDDD